MMLTTIISLHVRIHIYFVIPFIPNMRDCLTSWVLRWWRSTFPSEYQVWKLLNYDGCSSATNQYISTIRLAGLEDRKIAAAGCWDMLTLVILLTWWVDLNDSGDMICPIKSDKLESIISEARTAFKCNINVYSEQPMWIESALGLKNIALGYFRSSWFDLFDVKQIQ